MGVILILELSLGAYLGLQGISRSVPNFDTWLSGGKDNALGSIHQTELLFVSEIVVALAILFEPATAHFSSRFCRALD